MYFYIIIISFITIMLNLYLKVNLKSF